jgi:hypothetical protein
LSSWLTKSTISLREFSFDLQAVKDHLYKKKEKEKQD